MIIKAMDDTPGCPRVLFDEILHSIFFLGVLVQPKCLPKDIVNDDDMLNKLKTQHPGPFQFCSSRLPRRSPISCFLDMTVLLTREENERDIIKKMRELMDRLKEDGENNTVTDLVSSTICVSQKNTNAGSVRYYGASMSTNGPLPGRIIVAACCLSNFWDSYVAGAEMTFYPKKEKDKKSYFDGTIKLPGAVRCQAFSLTNGEPMKPCKSCSNMFGLRDGTDKEWVYGNCAEPESVSKLLQHEREVREQSSPKSPTATEVNRQRAKESMEKDLSGFVKTLKFQWDGNYYTPQ